MKNYFLLLAFTLTACAGSTFKKTEGKDPLSYYSQEKEGESYSITDLEEKSFFEAQGNFEPSSPRPYRRNYLLRAVGEECLARGYSYFNYGYFSGQASKVAGFCFKGPVRKTIAADFEDKEIVEGTAPRLVVTENSTTPNSTLKKGDVIVEINEYPISHPNTLFRELFIAQEKGMPTVQLRLERNGVSLATQEPLVEHPQDTLSKNFDRAYLEDLRERI